MANLQKIFLITGIVVFLSIMGVFLVTSTSEELTPTVLVQNHTTILNNIYGSSFGNEIGEVLINFTMVYYNVTHLEVGELNGFTFNSSGYNELTALNNGLYKIDAGFSFSGSANTEYHLRIAKNNLPADNCHAQRKIGTGGDVGTGSTAPCLVRLNKGDMINIQIENVNSATNPFIHDIGLVVVRLGD